MGKGENRRTKQLRQVAGLYSLHPDAGIACVYCGIRADGVDHVPPLSLVADFGIGWVDANNLQMYLYPACSECNSLLLNESIFDLDERRKYVKGKLRKRYKNVLKGGIFTRDELDELGWTLRQAIEAHANVREWVTRRLAW